MVGEYLTIPEMGFTEGFLQNVALGRERTVYNPTKRIYRETAIPRIAVDRDPPVRNIFHITTTNGDYTPMVDRHSIVDADVGSGTGLVLEQDNKHRPGGQQIKFSLWVSKPLIGDVHLDGYSAGDYRQPLIYPIFVKEASENLPCEAKLLVEDFHGALGKVALNNRRRRRGDPITKRALGKMKRHYSEPKGSVKKVWPECP